MSADVFALFRRFRHDLLNELQIVSGHVQLGRPHEVLRKDVQTVIDRILEVSQIFTCRNDQLALLLWSWLEQARDLEVSVSFDLSSVPSDLPPSSLEHAHRLVSLLLPEIAKIEEPECWLHVRLDPNEPKLRVTTPLISPARLQAIMPDALDLMQAGEDEELEFSMHLSCSGADQ